MRIKYYQIYTRPSLDHFFIMEKLAGDYGLYPNNIYTACICTFPESITWSELIARKSELRPDLLDWLESMDPVEFENTEVWGTGPSWNPLALTFTSCLDFPDLDAANAAYASGMTDEHIARLRDLCVETSNTFSERIEDEEGNNLPDFGLKY